MADLLDPNLSFTPAQVPIFEALCSSLRGTDASARNQANEILNQLKEAGTLWMHVDTIIENAVNADTKSYALIMLEHAVNTAWNTLPMDNRNSIKNYIVGKVIASCTDKSIEPLQHRLNIVLVCIVKREWTNTWRDFIPEICGASRSSQPLCENTMKVLKILSEEIFDTHKNNLTSARRKNLKETMNNEFSKIYELCNWILTTSIEHQGAVQNSLIARTLETLAAFLDWVPPAVVFESQMTNMLIEHFLTSNHFRSHAVRCLTEIAKITLEIPPQDPSFMAYVDAVTGLSVNVMTKLQLLIPRSVDAFTQIIETTPDGQEFFQTLALFIQAFVSTHIDMLDNLAVMYVQTPQYAVIFKSLDGCFSTLQILTEVQHEEIFKTCCDIWNWLGQRLFNARVQPNFNSNPLTSQIYLQAVTKARSVLVPRMAKPTEVTVSSDDFGNIVHEEIDISEVALYETMRETLIYFTNLDPVGMEKLIMMKMERQLDSSEFSWTAIASLCYAIGSISGAMPHEQEKKFLVRVIKDLLSLTESLKGKDNKAVVASNIMYVVMQYPRFLSENWNFLKTVIRKLFEFMHEAHPGIKDMSVDTFLKISQKCGSKFTIIQPEQPEPYIIEITRIIDATISDLENHQKFVFYEALGNILSNVDATADIANQIQGALFSLNNLWQQIIQQFSANPEAGQSLDILKALAFVIKANQSFCKSLGHNYHYQLSNIFENCMQFYTVLSQQITRDLQQHGHAYSTLRAARSVRKEIINLLKTYFQVCQDIQILAPVVAPNLLNIILSDFINSHREVREAEVIELAMQCIIKLSNQTPHLDIIFSTFLDSALEMITVDQESYPDHRAAFFEFIKVIGESFVYLLSQIPLERLKIILDAIIWAGKHTHPQMSELGIQGLTKLLTNISMDVQFSNYFFQNFYTYILNEMLGIMTDGFHLQTFKDQCALLRLLFELVEQGSIQSQFEQNVSNKDHVIKNLQVIIQQHFSQINAMQMEAFILALFNKCQDKDAFKTVLRDFMVNIKEISADDPAFYADERDREVEESRKREQDRMMSVPGLNPQFPGNR